MDYTAICDWQNFGIHTRTLLLFSVFPFEKFHFVLALIKIAHGLLFYDRLWGIHH